MRYVESRCAETMELLAYAQQRDRELEALLLFEDTLYVQAAVVDEWLSRAARVNDPLLGRLVERIRQARDG